MTEPSSSRPPVRTGSASDRALGAIVLVLFLLGLGAIAWYRGLADGRSLLYLGSAIVGSVLFLVLVVTTSEAKPRRLAVALVILLLLLLARCSTPSATVADQTEPTAPFADPRAPVPPKPTPIAKPTPPVPPVAPTPEPVAKPTPPPPPPEPEKDDLSQMLWEQFVWDPRSKSGGWRWRRIPLNESRTYSTDTATNAANLKRLQRERDKRAGSRIEWSGGWADGSSGTRLVLTTVEPREKDWQRLEDLAKDAPDDVQFLWEPDDSGAWSWKRIAREPWTAGLRDGSSDSPDYQRLAAARARIPDSSLEWFAHWPDGYAGWRLVVPDSTKEPIPSSIPARQIIRR